MNNAQNTQYSALILRLSLGIMLIAHGLLKVIVFTVPGAVEFFSSVGFPGWMAYIVIAAEIGGGVLMLGGVFTRWVALGLLPIMLGAVSVHLHNGWVFSAPNGGWEYPAFLTVALIVQALLGPGAFALQQMRSPSAAHA